jgi:hypothetical protein
MKLVFRTIVFHMFCVLLFSAFYFQTLKKPYIDCVSLSTTIQSGVGMTSFTPNDESTKILMLIQQACLISTHVFTIYIFTL